MVTLTVTRVKLHEVGPLRSAWVSLEASCREKHDGANIIDLRSIDINIFSIYSLKMQFLMLFPRFHRDDDMILHKKIFVALTWHMAAAN